MAAKDSARGLEGVFRLDAAVGPDVENELLVVGALTDTGVPGEKIESMAILPISWSGFLFPSARQKPRPVRTSHSISSVPSTSSVQISWRGFSTWTLFSAAKSPAVTVQGPLALRVIVCGSREYVLMSTRLRLRTMSVTSSAQPLIVQNSWLTPLIFTAHIAAPSMDERRTRLRELPIVRA